MSPLNSLIDAPRPPRRPHHPEAFLHEKASRGLPDAGSSPSNHGEVTGTDGWKLRGSEDSCDSHARILGEQNKTHSHNSHSPYDAVHGRVVAASGDRGGEQFIQADKHHDAGDGGESDA